MIKDVKDGAAIAVFVVVAILHVSAQLYPNLEPLRQMQETQRSVMIPSQQPTYVWNSTISPLSPSVRKNQDYVLFHKRVYKHHYPWNKYLTKDVIYPNPGNRELVKITKIYAMDMSRNRNGGIVHILNGGVGSRNVTLRFVSLLRKPIDYDLVIYGYKY